MKHQVSRCKIQLIFLLECHTLVTRNVQCFVYVVCKDQLQTTNKNSKLEQPLPPGIFFPRVMMRFEHFHQRVTKGPYQRSSFIWYNSHSLLTKKSNFLKDCFNNSDKVALFLWDRPQTLFFFCLWTKKFLNETLAWTVRCPGGLHPKGYQHSYRRRAEHKNSLRMLAVTCIQATCIERNKTKLSGMIKYTSCNIFVKTEFHFDQEFLRYPSEDHDIIWVITSMLSVLWWQHWLPAWDISINTTWISEMEFFLSHKTSKCEWKSESTATKRCWWHSVTTFVQSVNNFVFNNSNNGNRQLWVVRSCICV